MMFRNSIVIAVRVLLELSKKMARAEAESDDGIEKKYCRFLEMEICSPFDELAAHVRFMDVPIRIQCQCRSHPVFRFSGQPSSLVRVGVVETIGTIFD